MRFVEKWPECALDARRANVPGALVVREIPLIVVVKSCRHSFNVLNKKRDPLHEEIQQYAPHHDHHSISFTPVHNSEGGQLTSQFGGAWKLVEPPSKPQTAEGEIEEQCYLRIITLLQVEAQRQNCTSYASE